MILLNYIKNISKIFMKNYETNYIPRKDELKNVASEMYPTGHRKWLQNGTNCVWEMINYIKNWRNIKLFAKKSFIKWDISKFEEEYKYIKSKFKNIVPNQGFVPSWNDIFVFCAPIAIKIDILVEENREYLVETIFENQRLLKQLKFFIKKYEELQDEWHILDLYWTENLVISDDNKLFYIDSFLVFNNSNIVQKWSIENIDFLKWIIEEVENREQK